MTNEEKIICFDAMNNLNNVGDFTTLYYGKFADSDKFYFLDGGCAPYTHNGGFAMTNITRTSPKMNLDIYNATIDSLNNIGDTTVMYTDVPFFSEPYFWDRGCIIDRSNLGFAMFTVTRVSPKGRVLLPHTKH